MSDVHVGSGLFRQDLLQATIEETNALEPDLVAVVGDLTMEGYRWEFEEARGFFDQLTCPNVVYSMGNHDAKNVGYRHFEEFFGIREQAVEIPVPRASRRSSRSTRPSRTSTRARSGGSTTAGSTRSSGIGTGGRRYS
jgi:3',5'-cyclic AMP phosphodiesterase CpdA